MELDSLFWCLIALACLFVVLGILAIISYFNGNLKGLFVRKISQPILIQRRRWDSVTRLDAILLLFYLSLNVLFLLVPFTELSEWRKIEKKSALLSAIQIFLLCTGMRLGPVQILNFHRTSYHIFHHWTGRFAILQAICHSIIVISQRPEAETPGAKRRVYTGYGLFGGLLVILATSLVWLRTAQGRWFSLCHQVLAVVALAVLFWHVLCTSSIIGKVIIGLSCFCSSVSLGYKGWKLLFPLSATIFQARSYDESNIVTIEAELKQKGSLHVTPGSYFLISVRHHIPSVAAVAVLCGSETNRTTSALKFIFSESSWNRSLIALKPSDKISLDGPYGKDYGLENYENVMLLAKGIGIVGLLPLAVDLAERKYHDSDIQNQILKHEAQRNELFRNRFEEWEETRRDLERKRCFLDATKKVVILWCLEDYSQMKPLTDELLKLKKLDSAHKLLVVWCRYKAPAKTPTGTSETGVGKLEKYSPPFYVPKDNWFWKCMSHSCHAFERMMATKVADERRREKGKMVVAVCGDPNFTKNMREATISGSAYMPIDFIEIEYRPRAGY
uniref:Ferric oxidoreductase domain-containing protein n=1 Tax=Bionectria ochroleuca TaxID=29856 RepID=A0A0B7KRG5_BIOOC